MQEFFTLVKAIKELNFTVVDECLKKEGTKKKLKKKSLTPFSALCLSPADFKVEGVILLGCDTFVTLLQKLVNSILNNPKKPQDAKSVGDLCECLRLILIALNVTDALTPSVTDFSSLSDQEIIFQALQNLASPASPSYAGAGSGAGSASGSDSSVPSTSERKRFRSGGTPPELELPGAALPIGRVDVGFGRLMFTGAPVGVDHKNLQRGRAAPPPRTTTPWATFAAAVGELVGHRSRGSSSGSRGSSVKGGDLGTPLLGPELGHDFPG